MTQSWNTNDDLTKKIISSLYLEINDQVEEMVEDIGCPRSFAEMLLKTIANNFIDGEKIGKG